jgi:ribosomal protein L16 Arg81 hydroxylase
LIGLEQLVQPLSRDAFLAAYWPHRPYAGCAAPDAVARLSALAGLRDTEDLLQRYTGPISALRMDGSSCRCARALDALPLYADGCTLYARHVERVIPELDAVLRQLCKELEMPWTGSASAEVFASNGPSGVSMHSDYDVNFQVLLRGSKRWRLAKNEHVRNQTSVCLPGNRPQRDPLQLTIADRLPLPDTFPDDALSIERVAGSTLFVPRGYWHETEASGECLALNFVIKGPQWRELLLSGLAAHLVHDPAWRDFAYGLGAPGDRNDARTAFARLIEQLMHELSSCTSEAWADKLTALALQIR